MKAPAAESFAAGAENRSATLAAGNKAGLSVRLPDGSRTASRSFAVTGSTTTRRRRPRPASQPTHPARENVGSTGASSRGELYEYFKRIGALEVFFALFPDP